VGQIGQILEFFRITKGTAKTSDVKVKMAGAINATVDHFAPPGDDSFPLAGDYCALVPQNGEGRLSSVGYIDPQNEQKAQQGDKRVYARDSGGGQVVELWLKNDGSAILTNGAGAIELQSGGNVVINGVAIDTSGNITTPASVNSPSMVVNGKELAEHTHISAAPGIPTGPNL
jgi:hypothetical protein